MKWLHRQRESQPTDAPADEAVCGHLVLIPMWDTAEDVGHEADVSRYRCESCGALFSPQEATRLRATEADRVKDRVSA